MTELIVHDSIKILKPLYLSTDPPKVRLQRVNEALLTETSFIAPWQRALGGSDDFGAGVQQAAGYFTMRQQGWGLFNPTRRLEASAWAFERFEELDILTRIEHQLQSLLSAYPIPALERLNVILFPADPANAGVMRMEHGFASFGNVPGWLVLQMWPDEGNIARLDAMLAHAYASQIRQNAFEGKALRTLADHLVMQGLAPALIDDHTTNLDVPNWAVSIAPPVGWDDTLQQIAAMYDLKSYDDMIVNVYGHMIPVGPERPPLPETLDPEEFAYATAVIGEALAESHAVRIAAYLYGDEIVAARGHAPVGLSPFSGFYVGKQLIADHGMLTGTRLADTFQKPTNEILNAAHIFQTHHTT